MAKHFQTLGIMSGSSLDGLDFAVCDFDLSTGPDGQPIVDGWQILAAETDAYPPMWKARLQSAPHLPGDELWRAHADLGRWMGKRAKSFLAKHPELAPTVVGSHGHTIFHDPDRGFTTQIGDGAFLASEIGLTTITEFRATDVANGGQGAPLAPLADKYLFPDHGAFVNLGGIANLSVRQADGNYLAGDITGCCQILDRLAALEGLPYDDGGRLAASGSFNAALAERIGALPFHQLTYPKSLGNAWVREKLWPILQSDPSSVADRLHTFTKWLAAKISVDLAGAAAGANQVGKAGPTILVTGGGAKNAYLLQQLNRAWPKGEGPSFITPGPLIADFKEAALMALAALLRTEGLPNALSSATGARRDTVNGAVYLP